MQDEELRGADELRLWLADQGFRFQKNMLGYPENACNWLAYRRSELPARRCECNNDKEGVQVVVKPHDMTSCDHRSQSVEIEVCGEAGGVWWDMKAYSMKHEDVPGNLKRVEAMLVAAWNALVSP